MAKAWIPFYSPGTQVEIPDPPFRNLGEMASITAEQYKDSIAFTAVMPNGLSGDLTFAQTDRFSDAFAAYLREVIGLKQGDRVALQIPNGLAFPVVAFGVFKAGCVLVNVNPLYTPEEMGRVFADAKPQALVVIDMFANKLPLALAAYDIPHIILSRAAELFPLHKRLLISLIQKYARREIPSCRMPHTLFDKALELGEQALHGRAYVRAPIDGSAVACLQYTGGTTGNAKGAMLSHRNLLMNMAQKVEMVGHSIERGKEVLLTVLPLYHIFAFTVNFLGFYWIGARNILIPNPRPLTNLRKAFANYPVSWMTGVNTLFNGLSNSKWFTTAPPRTLKHVIAGGMTLQVAVAERWQQLMGYPIIEGYGLTEASPVVTFNPFNRPKLGSIGIPVPSTDVRFLDDKGKDVAPGEPGELAVKGPQVMLGYWQRPQETAKAIKDGWLLTGDIATIDQEGYIRIVDRKKDMIIHSGFNIYPNEIEECLVKHPGILEAAVIGVADGAVGESVKAFIIRRDPSLTANQIRDYCKEHLTAYKVPKFIEFRDELPKSNVGKILRKDLRIKN